MILLEVFLVSPVAEHIEFAMANISSLREQTYRPCRGLLFVPADKKESDFVISLPCVKGGFVFGVGIVYLYR